jgi:hypothetical protein
LGNGAPGQHRGCEHEGWQQVPSGYRDPVFHVDRCSEQSLIPDSAGSLR